MDKKQVTVKIVYKGESRPLKDAQGFPKLDKDGNPRFIADNDILFDIDNTNDILLLTTNLSADELERQGIKEGAKGTVEYYVKTIRCTDPAKKPFNKVNMYRFTLNNAGIFQENVPAASGEGKK